MIQNVLEIIHYPLAQCHGGLGPDESVTIMLETAALTGGPSGF